MSEILSKRLLAKIAGNIGIYNDHLKPTSLKAFRSKTVQANQFHVHSMSRTITISTLTLYTMLDPYGGIYRKGEKHVELMVTRESICTSSLGIEYDCMSDSSFVVRLDKTQAWKLFGLFKVYDKNFTKGHDISLTFTENGEVIINGLRVRKK